MSSQVFKGDEPYRTALVYRDTEGYFVEYCEDGFSIEQVFPTPDTQDEAEGLAYKWTKQKI